MLIAPRPTAETPWVLRPFFWNQRRKYGRELDAARLWTRAPKLFVAVALLYGMIDRRGSPIEPCLRSLITVRVSQLNGCAFCVDINAATLLKRGVSTEKLAAVAQWRTSPLFSDFERAALDFAEAMTRLSGEVTKSHIEALRRHLDDDAIVELAGLIGFQNMSSKFNSAFDVPTQGFCSIPVPVGDDGKRIRAPLERDARSQPESDRDAKRRGAP